MMLWLACAAPWTLGAAPTEAVPAASEVHHPVPTASHAVMVDEPDLADFARAWRQAGGPSLTIVVLGPDEGPIQPQELEIAGVTVIDGELKSSSATLSREVAPAALPNTGWAGAVAVRLQQELLAHEVTVVDGAWAAAGDGEGGELSLEVKRVPEDTGPALQLRVLGRDGEVLALTRRPVHLQTEDGWARAAEMALAELRL